jgi:hypothetical protein
MMDHGTQHPTLINPLSLFGVHFLVVLRAVLGISILQRILHGVVGYSSG